MEQNKYDGAVRSTPPYALRFHLAQFRNLAEIVTAKFTFSNDLAPP